MRRSILIATLAILGTLLLPVAYAASEGPAVWLAQRGLIERQTVERAYRPLMLMGRTMPRLGYLRYQYLDLWLPGPTVCRPGPRLP